MTNTKLLLESIFKNSQMGIKTLEELLSQKIDTKLKRVLNSQKDEYMQINKEAEKLMSEKGYEPKNVNKMAVMMSKMTINAKTMMDDSSCHVAEMVIKGSCNGLIEATKNIRLYAEADAEALLLAQKLLRAEEKNFDEMKAFLG